MAMQLSTTVRNARLDAIEDTITAEGDVFLRIYSGSMPANCGAAETGTLLAECELSANFMAAAASGAKAKTGKWEDLAADHTGTAGYFRIVVDKGPLGEECHIQGTVTGTGGGGDMEVSSTSFTTGQKFTVNTFTITDANA